MKDDTDELHRKAVSLLEQYTKEKLGIYEVEKSCWNCNITIQHQVPRGVPFHEYFNGKKPECPNCGCKPI